MRLVGLDLSLTAAGVVVADGDELEPEAGLRIVRAETLKAGTLRGVERLHWLTTRVRDIAAPHDGRGGRAPVDLAGIEGYSYASRNGAHQLGELGGCVRLSLHVVGVPFMEIPPGTWRKQLFGKGNLPKGQVPLEIFKRYQVELDSVDELEAYAVALAAFRTSCGLDQPEPRKRRSKEKP